MLRGAALEILRFAQDDRGGVDRGKEHLVLADLVTFFSPEKIFLQGVTDIEITLFAFGQDSDWDFPQDFLPRTDPVSVERAATNLFAICDECPTGVVGARLVIVAVKQADLGDSIGNT